MEKNILRFNSYLKSFNRINESSTPVATIQELIGAFTKTYSLLFSKCADYKDASSDLLAVMEEKDPEKRAQQIADILNKVAGSVDPKYGDVKSKVKEIGKNIQTSFADVAKSKEAQENKSTIDKMISTLVLGLSGMLKGGKANESHELAGKNHVLSYSDYITPVLLEKNTFEDEREELIKQMTSTYTDMKLQQKTPTTDTLKSEADKVVGRFDEITALLKDNSKWEAMKRKERKNKIEELSKEIAETSTKVAELKTSELEKLGIEEKNAKAISGIITGITDLETEIKKVDDAELAKATEKQNKDKLYQSLSVGDVVKYKKDDGTEAEGEITKITGGDNGGTYEFKDKEGKTFTKKGTDIISKVEKKEEEKKEEKNETFKIENPIKATGNSPKGEELDQTKKIFEMICDKFTANDKISGMDEWGKSNFCKPNKFYIGQSRTTIIKAIKKELGLEDKNADLTPEFVEKLSALEKK